jgi:hypothetical protein
MLTYQPRKKRKTKKTMTNKFTVSEWFLRSYVFHRLRQIKKPEVPIVAYTTANDIFEREEQEKESGAS